MPSKPPLYLPKGSIRAILAGVLTVTTCVGFMLKLITAETFVPLATMALAFYFSDRTSSGAS